MTKKNAKSHNQLKRFMISATNEMEAEYHRIRERSNEDPGTAGDEGEENWAQLLREWLPPYYRVVTKGRILNREGKTSPQVDIIVLHPTYPEKLSNKKHYLSDGIVAAFECKLTLKANDIKKTILNSAKIRGLLAPRRGTPYKELNSPLFFGLLAHSHSWKRKNSDPVNNIYQNLFKADHEFIKHPREMLDVLCVSDLAAYTASKQICFGPQQIPPQNINSFKNDKFFKKTYGEEGKAQTSYMCSTVNEEEGFTPIGRTISYLLGRLAWENPELQKLADYFLHCLPKVGTGLIRTWPLDIYSTAVRKILATSPIKTKAWDEWSDMFWL